MDLFTDEYYLLQCTKQLDYYKVLYAAIDDSTPNNYTKVGTLTIMYQDSNSLLATGSGYLIKTSSGKYCHEIRLTNTLKRIILE
jgi:hypothetical protein